MAKQKIDGLILGKGAINANTTSSQQFSSTSPMGTWLMATPYPLDAMVEYSGKYYRSLSAGNTGNQPDTSPTFWEIFSNEVRDGDVAIIVAGVLSDIMVRNNTRWISLVGIPIFASLNDNQLGQLLFQIPLSVARGATIEYTVQRGLDERRGTMRYQSDGNVGPTGAALADYDNVDIGAGNVGTTFSAEVDGTGTFVQIYGDTDNQGFPALIKYVLKGWS